MKWVKSSERMPLVPDGDADGDVLVRWLAKDSWLATAVHWSAVSLDEEWLEGAFDKPDLPIEVS